MQNNRDTHHRRREKSAGAKESIRRFRHFFPSRSEIGASHTPPRSLVPHPCSFLGQRDDLCFPPLLFSPFPLFLTPPLFTSHPSFLSLSLSPLPFLPLPLSPLHLGGKKPLASVACLNVNDERMRRRRRRRLRRRIVGVYRRRRFGSLGRR